MYCSDDFINSHLRGIFSLKRPKILLLIATGISYFLCYVVCCRQAMLLSSLALPNG